MKIIRKPIYDIGLQFLFTEIWYCWIYQIIYYLSLKYGLHKGMKVLLMLNKISIQNSKKQRDIIPLRRKKKKKVDGKTEINHQEDAIEQNLLINKVNCFAVWYVLPIMSLKNCILALLHKTSENGFVFSLHSLRTW